MAKALPTVDWLSRIRTRRGFAALLLAVVAPAVIAAVSLDDPDVMLYPLPDVVYDTALDITGSARPHQVIDIEINGTIVGRTLSNESGDFVVAVRPSQTINQLRALMPQAKWASDSGLKMFRFEPDLIAGKAITQQAGARKAMAATDVSPMLAPAAPVLTAPPATSTTNPITMSGTAAASSTVKFYVNGRNVRSATATATGTFSTWVPLEDGANAIYVTATNAQAETSPASNTVQTSYTNNVSRSQTGTISQNTVWTKGNATPYSLTGNLTIAPGVVFWIQPGVVINASGNYKIIAQGSLWVAASSTERAVFKAAAAGCNGTSRRADWAGIEVPVGGSADLDYAQVQCADTAVNYAGGRGSIRHSQVINNTRGARMEGASASALVSPAISASNEFRNNAYGISVQKNARPTISAGNIFDNNDYAVYIYGALDATQDPQPVISNSQFLLTNDTDVYTGNFVASPVATINARGNWWGTTDHGVIATKVYDWHDDTNRPIVDFTGYLGAAGGAAYFTGTTLIGVLTANTTLPAGEAQTLGSITVNAGVTLTLSAGTTFNLATGSKLLVKGTLTVNGTSAARATFKPSTPSCNGVATSRTDWAGIEVAAGGIATINYADVLCATRGLYLNSGTGSVKNSRFLNNQNGIEMIAVTPARTTPSITTANEIQGSSNGIVVRQNTSPTISGSQFAGNTDAIWIVGNSIEAQNPAPKINSNSFQTSSSRHIYADSFGNPRLVRIDAKSNWWGTADAGAIMLLLRDWTDDQNTLPVVDYSGFLSAAGGSSAWTGPTLNGPVTANQTLTGVEYLMLGRVEVDPGITVTANAGAKVTVPGNLPLVVKGALNINGTSVARVVFKPATAACTDTASKRQDWLGVSYQTGSTGIVNYADVYCANSGIYIASSPTIKAGRFYGNETAIEVHGVSASSLASPNIRENEVRGSDYGIYVDIYSSPVINEANLITSNTYGIYLYGSSDPLKRPTPAINANNIFGNATYDLRTSQFASDGSTQVVNARGNWWGTADPEVIAQNIFDYKNSSTSPHVDFSGYLQSQGGTAVFTGTTLIGHVSANRTLAAGQYQVLGSLNVDAGVTLTLDPGAQLRFLPGRSVQVAGTLVALGTSAQRVVFTSLAAYPAKGDWYGIKAIAGGTMQITHARVEYSTNGFYFGGGAGWVRESLSWFNTYGVVVEAKSSPTISPNNEVTNNDYGIWVDGQSSSVANNPLPVVTNNNIYNNTTYNFYARSFVNPTSVVLNATSNWWSATDPAAIRAKIYTGSTTSPTVDIGTPLTGATGPLAIQLSGVSTTVRQVQPLDNAMPARGVYSVSRGGSVKVQIRSQSDNSLVYQATQMAPAAGTFNFSWNGRTAAGTVVPEGMYRAVLTANDGRDEMTADFKPVAGTATTSGSPSSTYRPFHNEFYKETVTLAQPGLVSLKVTPTGGAEFYAWRDVYYPAGSNWVYWDGRDPAGNVITVPVSILVTDSTAVVATAIQVLATKPTITGLLAAPDIEVKADPYLVTHSYEQLTRMAYRLSADSYVRFVLLPPGEVDIHGAAAIVLVDNELQTAKDAQGAAVDHVVEWRGYDSANPSHVLVNAEGAYTFAIEAKEATTNQSTVYRGVINLRQ